MEYQAEEMPKLAWPLRLQSDDMLSIDAAQFLSMGFS